ncbi:unnamed protein product [Ectocarpus fasciculatus]
MRPTQKHLHRERERRNVSTTIVCEAYNNHCSSHLSTYLPTTIRYCKPHTRWNDRLCTATPQQIQPVSSPLHKHLAKTSRRSNNTRGLKFFSSFKTTLHPTRFCTSHAVANPTTDGYHWLLPK